MRRIGRFWISKRMIDDHPDDVIRIFQRLNAIVVRCELMYHRDAFEYMAISKSFREIDVAEMVPDYEIIIKTTPYDFYIELQEIK